MMTRTRFSCRLISFAVVVLLAGWSLQSCKQTSKPAAQTAADSTKVKSDSTMAAPADSTAHAADTAQTAVVQLSYEERLGKGIFSKFCAVCHGEGGAGDGFNAFNLNPRPRDFTDAKIMHGITDDQIIQTIRDGGRSSNHSVLMPAWGGRLSDREIRFAMQYVRTFARDSTVIGK